MARTKPRRIEIHQLRPDLNEDLYAVDFDGGAELDGMTAFLRRADRRRHIIAEPLASHHTMTAALCRNCHNLYHAEPERFEAKVIKATALERGSAWWHLPAVSSAVSLETLLKADGSWDELLAASGVERGPQK